MSVRSTRPRLAAVTAAGLSAVVCLSTPATAHVGATPSETAAGAFTVVTMSVPHGCEGSPTTRVEIQVPESVLAVTPTRNPFYDLRTKVVRLAEPVTDSHGNEVTERTGSIVYSAREPLPEGQRDTFELSLQVPDLAGEVLAFPTIQTCEKGETAWTEVPAEGQDAEELEHPAPAFEVTAASTTGHVPTESAAASGDSEGGEESTDDLPVALGWAGLVLGALGLLAGGAALARSRKPA